MSDVFISYANQDRGRAQMLAQALQAAGFSVWWDRDIAAGQSYDQVIEHELETARSVVVLWSRHSVISEWVKSEAQVAVERGTLVPAIIDAVRIPLEFRRKQGADLVGWDGDPQHAGLGTLHRGIAAHLARGVPVPLPRASELDGLTQAPTRGTAGRRKRRTARRAGAAALVIIGMVGLWAWDAFYRPHVTHYANVTKRRGVPEGIGEVSIEQVRHRNITLAFLRHGRRGRVKEIRAVNGRGSYPHEFAYHPPTSLLELNPLLTNMAEILNTCRITFDYDNGRIVRQSAYDRNDRLIYTLHYPQPDIAEYKWQVFSRVVRESGISHIKFVRVETGAEAGLDKDVVYLSGNGTPSQDRNGGYGYRFVFNKLGRPIEAIPLGADQRPAANRLGIARVVSEYDELGNLSRRVNLGVDGRPVTERHGSETRVRYDEHGNTTEIVFLDASGQLVTSERIGAAGATYAYDGQGNVIENTFFGPDRQLVLGRLGVAKQKIAWDERGNSVETYYGPDGKPSLVFGRVVKVKGRWDKRGRLEEMAFLDENGHPVRNDGGCAKTRMGRDEYGNVADVRCLDEGDQPVRNTSGAARVKSLFDQSGNKIEENYFGPDDRPERYGDHYVRVRWKYNAQGKLTQTTYFDAADRPVKNRDGYATAGFGYDLHGNLRELTFLDEEGRPIVRRGGYARILRTYDARDKVLTEAVLDPEEKPVRSEDGYVKARFVYDTRGYRVETSYYDERDRLISGRSGCAKERNQFNDKGQRTGWACLGADDLPIVSKQYGYAAARRIYDAGGRLLRRDFFDAKGDPIRSADGYARVSYSYDELGREIKRDFYDVNGEALPTRVTITKVEPGSKGHAVGLQSGDAILAYDGRGITDDRQFRELELLGGDRPRRLTLERGGKSLIVDVAAGRLTGSETVERAFDRKEAKQGGR
jgi:YD repeat-containing protein